MGLNDDISRALQAQYEKPLLDNLNASPRFFAAHRLTPEQTADLQRRIDAGEARLLQFSDAFDKFFDAWPGIRLDAGDDGLYAYCGPATRRIDIDHEQE